MTLAYHVVEVCSTEVIAEVHLPDYELDFDRELLEVRKGGWCSWGWRDVKHECLESFFLCLISLDFCDFFFFLASLHGTMMCAGCF